MHAALISLTIEPEHAPAAAGALMNDILPKITSAPGFVAGYWLEPAEGQGQSILMFETEEQARDASRLTTEGDVPGITINSVDIRRVALSVP